MHHRYLAGSVLIALGLAVGSTANAQAPAPGTTQAPAKTRKWSAEVAFGFDNSISGNINSSGIGTINAQTVVITKNTYEQVYGTGLTYRFGGGYMIDDVTEVRGIFTGQSLDADLTPMGEIGPSRLYGQYDDYQYFGLDVGLRHYGTLRPKIRPYSEAAIGIGWLNETDVLLVAPAANLSGNATDFYDQTAAFTMSANVGLLVETHDRMGVFAQVGLRWVSGMTAVDGLAGTGLETINDNSSRWTVPFLLGLRVDF